MSILDKLNTLIPMEDIEIKAQQQIYNALGFGFLIKLAVMPDVHCGYSLPIGGIMSGKPTLETAKEYKKMNIHAKELGCKLNAPFMTLSFIGSFLLALFLFSFLDFALFKFFFPIVPPPFFYMRINTDFIVDVIPTYGKL